MNLLPAEYIDKLIFLRFLNIRLCREKLPLQQCGSSKNSLSVALLSENVVGDCGLDKQVPVSGLVTKNHLTGTLLCPFHVGIGSHGRIPLIECNLPTTIFFGKDEVVSFLRLCPLQANLHVRVVTWRRMP